MHARLYLYVTFGHQGIQAALHICNFRPLKVKKVEFVSERGVIYTRSSERSLV